MTKDFIIAAVVGFALAVAYNLGSATATLNNPPPPATRVVCQDHGAVIVAHDQTIFVNGENAAYTCTKRGN